MCVINIRFRDRQSKMYFLNLRFLQLPSRQMDPTVSKTSPPKVSCKFLSLSPMAFMAATTTGTAFYQYTLTRLQIEIMTEPPPFESSGRNLHCLPHHSYLPGMAAQTRNTLLLAHCHCPWRSVCYSSQHYPGKHRHVHIEKNPGLIFSLSSKTYMPSFRHF